MSADRQTVRLADAEKQARFRLARTENVGPVTFQQLMARYGTAAEALDALPALAARGGLRRPLVAPTPARMREEQDALSRLKATILYWGDEAYPPRLADVPDAPPLLLVRGEAAFLHKPCIAFVGARNASLNGRRLAERLAREVGQAGWIVVSGLAAGIDGAAHRGALASGTIGVIAGGFDHIYPPEHASLYDSLREGGAIVTEMPPGTPITAQLFPRRNRIIAGLSVATVVVEAALKSGSLITARLASDYGREVLAVPGSPLDPRAGGVNRLLKDGATLVENAQDILASLTERTLGEREARPYTAPPPAPPDDQAVDAARPGVVEALSPTPTPVDEVIRLCHVPCATVWAVLLELELAGRLIRLPGNRVALVADPPS